MPTKEELRQKLLENIARIQQVIPDFTMTEEQIEECVSDRKYEIFKSLQGKKKLHGPEFDKEKNAIIDQYCDAKATHKSFARNIGHLCRYENTAEDKAYNKELFSDLNRDDEAGEEARDEYIKRTINVPFNYDLDFLISDPSDEELIAYCLEHEDEGAIGMAFSSFLDQLGTDVKYKDPEAMKQFGLLATSFGTYIQNIRSFMESEYYFSMPLSYMSKDQFERFRDHRDKYPGYNDMIKAGDTSLNDLMTFEEMRRTVPSDVQKFKSLNYKPWTRSDYEYSDPKEVRIAGGYEERVEALIAACDMIAGLDEEIAGEKMQSLKAIAANTKLMFSALSDLPDESSMGNLAQAAEDLSRGIYKYIKDNDVAANEDRQFKANVKELENSMKKIKLLKTVNDLKSLIRTEKEDREKILPWYNSLKDALKNDPEVNLDITKPADMISIRTCDFKVNTDTVAIGDPTEYKGSLSYAFIPKNLSADDHFDSYAADDEPPYPGAEEQEEIIAAVNANETAFTAYGNKVLELENAYNKNSAPEKLDQLEKELAEAKKERFESYKRFAEANNRVFGAKHAWTLKNQKQFDPKNKEDYKQIKYLYQQAEKGLLYVDLASADSEQKYQIGVNTNTKTAEIIKSKGANAARPQVIASVFDALKNGDPKESLGHGAEYYDFIAAHYEEFEKENGTDIRFLVNFTEKPPVRPAEVAKPGALSWIKRIFSLGIANGDFKRFDQYQRDLADYNRKAEEYPKRKEEVRKKNLASYEGVIKFINKYSKELGMQAPEGVQKVGEVTENMIRIHYTEENPLDLSEEYEAKGISSSMLKIEFRGDAAFRIEAHEKPGMFSEDGSIKEDVSKEYWDQKKELQKESDLKGMKKVEDKLSEARNAWKARIEEKAKQQKLEETKQLQADMKETAKKAQKSEIAEQENILSDKKNALYGKSIDIKEQIDDLEDLEVAKEDIKKISNAWASKSLNEYVRSVGSLFTQDPKQIWGKGVAAIGILACQNQEYYTDETQKPYSMLKTSGEIMPEIEALLDTAVHPGKKEENKELLDKIRLRMEEPDPGRRENIVMMFDSLCDIASRELVMKGGTSSFKEDMSKVTPALFVVSTLARNVAKQLQKESDVYFDYREGFKVYDDPQKKPVSIADAREEVLDFGDRCSRIRAAVNKVNQFSKEYMVIKEGKNPAEPDDLTIRRKLEVGE